MFLKLIILYIEKFGWQYEERILENIFIQESIKLCISSNNFKWIDLIIKFDHFEIDGFIFDIFERNGSMIILVSQPDVNIPKVIFLVFIS